MMVITAGRFINSVNRKMALLKRDIIFRFRRIKKGRKYKIGFIVQLVELWDQQINIYEELKKRDNVEVFLFVVPVNYRDVQYQQLYETNKYFFEKYEEAIKVILENGKTIDITQYELDYIFYPRPYDIYLPEEIQISRIHKKIKCCYVPYAYTLSREFEDLNINNEFFNYVDMYFFENNTAKEKFVRSRKIKNNQTLFSFGMPAFDDIYLEKNETKAETIMWTPRWSFDENLGRSNFLEYKDFFIRLLVQYSKCNFVFRPHPMLYDELIKKNLMKHSEWEEYIKKLSQNNCQYDYSTPIKDRILNTSVLITDISSIIPMFFLTGKPIIYCESNIQFCEGVEKMKKYMYVANDSNEIEYYLKQIISGNDYLRKDRINFIEKEFKGFNCATEKIVSVLLND